MGRRLGLRPDQPCHLCGAIRRLNDWLLQLLAKLRPQLGLHFGAGPSILRLRRRNLLQET